MRRTRPNFRSFGVAVVVLLAGCASSKSADLVVTSGNESPQEAVSALGHVAGAYAGRDLSEAELKKLAQDLQKDEEAQSAVKAIADTMEGKSAGIKYSPATGKRYSGNLEYDPETGVKLLPLEP
jgi:hypothetical protein